MVHLEVIQIPDAHIPMNCRHDLRRSLLQRTGLSLRPCVRSPGFKSSARSKVMLLGCVNGGGGGGGGHRRRLALQRPRCDFRRLQRGGGVKASHLGRWERWQLSSKRGFNGICMRNTHRQRKHLSALEWMKQ